MQAWLFLTYIFDGGMKMCTAFFLVAAPTPPYKNSYVRADCVDMHARVEMQPPHASRRPAIPISIQECPNCTLPSPN